MADTLLLARYAEAIFWLARYVERAENLARILDVNATFARDRRGAQDWMPVLELNADRERFAAGHPAPTAEAVLAFYVTDRGNPTSIASAVAAARENARALRPVISREMWAQLNVFHKWLAEVDGGALSPAGPARLLARVREACQTHTGITEGTLHRDQASVLYRLGRNIERADQTTRLLDIWYHHLLPSAAAARPRVDVVRWDALLRSAAAHHAFMRVVQGGVTPAGVAGFLLLHPRFPRSVAFCVGEADRHLAILRTRHGLPGGAGPAAELAALRSTLETVTIHEVIGRGVHGFLDGIRRRLIGVSDGVAQDFFRRSPPVPQQGQSQR